MTSPALELLHRVFGFPGFRGEQAAVVEHLVAGQDCLVLMPTGAGKSLCYQVPALLREGTGLVISPLIALMQDQVEALEQLGVRAAYLNSALSNDAASDVESRLVSGDLDLLYELAPGARLGWEIEQLEVELGELFGRRVDLVSKRSLHRRLRSAVLAEARELYAA